MRYIKLDKEVKELWFNQLYPVWREYYSTSDDRDDANPIYLPGIPSLPKENSLLIYGINPSSSKDYYVNELKGTKYSGKGKYLIKNLRWSRWKDRDISKFQLERIYDIEYALGTSHSFFVQFERIKRLTDFDYSFLDLYIRDSVQKNVVKKFLKAKSGSQEETFAQKQINISLQLLKNSNPKAIIVANAETSRVLLNHFKSNVTGSMRINGRYILLLNNANRCIYNKISNNWRNSN